MIRRTLMQRNQELVDFEADPATGEVRIVEVASDDLAAFADWTHQDGHEALARIVEKRAISSMREDKDDVLAAFGAKSPLDLALMGHGLSLSDHFWYRVPGGTERWEDINFFDNGWDPGFGAAVLSGDYAGLADCSPDVPEATTSGHAIKAWERDGDGVYLVKTAVYPDGSELIGAKLASDLCAAVFGEGSYVPMDIVERYGRPCSISPLMLSADEELADGNRLFAMAGMWEDASLCSGGITAQVCDACIRAYTALGIEGASAHVARMASLACLALLQDCNPSNFGAIRKVGSEAWRAAPIFDYDGSFGFPFNGVSLSDLCKDPLLAEFFCISRMSFLDSSWDWSWYDSRALDGFEGRIEHAFASCQSLPPNFAELIARLFAMQREYVDKVASRSEIA